MMKENEAARSNLQNHPSFESKFKPQKPSIKYFLQYVELTTK